MASTDLLIGLPHLGGIKPGSEPEHLLADPPFHRIDDVIDTIDKHCVVEDLPIGLRIAHSVIELTRHEENQGGLEYQTRSMIAREHGGITVVQSILTPKNGEDFGIAPGHYGGVHRMDDVDRFEVPFIPSLHWKNRFLTILSPHVVRLDEVS
jgi:hypothetical protein